MYSRIARSKRVPLWSVSLQFLLCHRTGFRCGIRERLRTPNLVGLGRLEIVSETLPIKDRLLLPTRPAIKKRDPKSRHEVVPVRKGAHIISNPRQFCGFPSVDRKLQGHTVARQNFLSTHQETPDLDAEHVCVGYIRLLRQNSDGTIQKWRTQRKFRARIAEPDGPVRRVLQLKLRVNAGTRFGDHVPLENKCRP